MYAVLVPFDPSSIKVQAGQFRSSAGAVNDQVELQGLGLARSFDTDLVAALGLLDRGDRR